MTLNRFHQFVTAFAAVCLIASTSGCGGPARVDAPEFDSAAAAAEAMSLYDEDGDGQLDKKELKNTAALLNAIDEIDEDKSGTISEEEIKARVDYFVQGRDGRISIACRVVKGGSPVRGATVTFDPEPFMGNMIEPATGLTNDSGMASVHINDDLGNIQPGFYKVRISRESKSGKETVKKKYNEETVLGQEVTSGSIQLSQGITFSI